MIFRNVFLCAFFFSTFSDLKESLFGIWFDNRLGHQLKQTNWSLVVSHFQGIEQLKKEERRWSKKTKWMNMRAVFGHPFSLLWFSPFSTPDHGKAETYQYVVWGLSKEAPPPVELSVAPNTVVHCAIVSPTLSICFLYFHPCALSVYFVLPSVSWVAEKKKALWVCESCLKTLNLFFPAVSMSVSGAFSSVFTLAFS